MEGDKAEAIELDVLLEAIHRRYGHDFRGYSRSHIIRRVKSFLTKSGQDSVAELIPKVLRDEAFFEKLVFEFSVTVTQMFRDPSVFRSIRTKVVPILRTYPFLRIWVAGCATGEEAYSMAILLKEEGLYDNSTIFATDFNDLALEKAREGIYHFDQIRQSTENYQQSGGQRSFSEYYHAEFGAVMLDQSLKKNLVFANHNLATDSVFSEMHLILCRNVMIYFDKELQNRVFGLFSDSLLRGGFLCIGTSEEVRFSNFGKNFSRTDYGSKIFKRSST